MFLLRFFKESFDFAGSNVLAVTIFERFRVAACFLRVVRPEDTNNVGPTVHVRNPLMGLEKTIMTVFRGHLSYFVGWTVVRLCDDGLAGKVEDVKVPSFCRGLRSTSC